MFSKRLCTLIIFLVCLAGCRQQEFSEVEPTAELYQDAHSGFSMEVPSNWRAVPGPASESQPGEVRFGNPKSPGSEFVSARDWDSRPFHDDFDSEAFARSYFGNPAAYKNFSKEKLPAGRFGGDLAGCPSWLFRWTSTWDGEAYNHSKLVFLAPFSTPEQLFFWQFESKAPTETSIEHEEATAECINSFQAPKKSPRVKYLTDNQLEHDIAESQGRVFSSKRSNRGAQDVRPDELVYLHLFWNGSTSDNLSCSARDNPEAENLYGPGYSSARLEGRILDEQRNRTIPLKLLRRGTDYLTAARRETLQEASEKGYQEVATLGYVFAQRQPGLRALELYYSAEREDYFLTGTNAGKASAPRDGYRWVSTEGWAYHSKEKYADEEVEPVKLL